MNHIPLPYRLLGIIGLVLALFASGYFYGRQAEGVKCDAELAEMKLARANEVNAVMDKVIKAESDNAKLKLKLGAQHAEAIKALNILMDHPAGRVLLPASDCVAANDEAHAASGSAIPTAQPERAGDQAQAALDEFKRGVEADAAEWSRALNACAVVMEWTSSANTREPQ